MGVIGTHNGQFHCDEAFACFMLKRMECFKDYTIVRTRDPQKLAECDIVVDVGGVFNHETCRYDHHQKEFTDSMQSLKILDFNTKLSSAGLVYAHYGKKVIAEILNRPEEDRLVNILFRRVYENFVEEIDAVDNGIPQYDGTPRYRTSGGISARVGRLNPSWVEQNVNTDERFAEGMKLVGAEFEECIRYLADVWWPARTLVEQAVKARKEIDASGRIIVMESGGVPWKEHLFAIEEELSLQNQNMTYILYEDPTSKTWRIQAIPTSNNAQFQNRLPLPKAWRSLRDGELSKVCGIEGCVFVHTSGFIGGNKTREGALEMARKALAIGEEETSSNGSDAKRSKLEA